MRYICLVFMVTVSFCMANAKDVKDLKTVTITAQKVEQSLQKVPMSASVTDEDDIEDDNIESLKDVSSVVANFSSIDSGMNYVYIPTIRGIYTNPAVSSENVGTYVDGVSFITFGNNIELENIQRVEVLRGPQSTLYGKYAYAGAINIITKKPTNETNGYIKGVVGNDGKRKVSVGASGAIIDNTLFLNVSASHNQKDGYINNSFLHRDDNYKKRDFGKLYLRYLPTSNLELALISTFFKDDDGSMNITPMSLPNPRENQSNTKSYSKPQGQTHAFKAKYSYGDTDFTSITTYRQVKPDRLTDLDGTANTAFNIRRKGKSKNLSQELRANGKTKSMKWLVGTLFDAEKDKITSLRYGTRGGRDFKVPSQNRVTKNSIGVFTNLDYMITHELTLTTGLRYDHDKSKIKDYLSSYSDEQSDGAFSPKISLSYQVNDDILTYFTIAKGYKSGGYFMFAPAGHKKFKDENLISYEAGLKTETFNGKLHINLAAFYMDIKDKQVMISENPSVGYVDNAASATSKGFEIESILKPINRIEIFANLGYTDMRFDTFKDGVGDYSGNYGPYAPKYDYNFGIKYRDPMGIFAQFDANGQSSFYADKENRYKNEGYTLLNAKVGYELENYEIYLYCNNIEDKNYDINGYSGSYVLVSPPREFGLKFAYRF